MDEETETDMIVFSDCMTELPDSIYSALMPEENLDIFLVKQLKKICKVS